MMRNPWLDIPLGDYEAHMALPAIGQSQLIADQLDILVRTYAPSSVAILGCAGGNGFERLIDTSVSRLVGSTSIRNISKRHGSATMGASRGSNSLSEIFKHPNGFLSRSISYTLLWFSSMSM